MGDEVDALLAQADMESWAEPFIPGFESDDHFETNIDSPSARKVYTARAATHMPNDFADIFETFFGPDPDERDGRPPFDPSYLPRNGGTTMESFYTGDDYSHERAENAASRRFAERVGAALKPANDPLKAAQERLEALLSQAEVAAAHVEALSRRRSEYPEPGDGMVIYFTKTFPRRRGGASKEYEFAAVRVEGMWHHTGKSQFLAKHGVESPCTWDQIIDFADEVDVAADWGSAAGWEAKVSQVIDGRVVAENPSLTQQAFERENELVTELRNLDAMLTRAREPGARATKAFLGALHANVVAALKANHDQKEGEKA